ncbi:MAG: pyrroline-5-carboxylate reductase [Pseudomonadales bacterium]|nr:pyrroline-5-carboxylate reductase [Pseudomonadales bacterium]
MTLALKNETAKLAFIGAGNMASSIIGGLINNGYPADLISASDPSEDALKKLSEQHGIITSRNNANVITGADAIILAVKPQIMQQVLTAIAADIQNKQPLIISIAAGITVNNIRYWLAPDLPIVRTMPNTPALVQTGATGLYANERVNSTQKAIASTIFESIGIAIWFDEETDMDRVVAISGSGPAYFFLVMEAMEQAGISLGLQPEVARKLTLQTALGSAKLALTENLDPAELRRRVTSPGGTTEAAIGELASGGLMQLFAKAIKAASDRSKELAG